MTMKKNRLLLAFFIIYSFSFAIFMTKILWDVEQKPHVLGPSAIPNLSVGQLEKTIIDLGKREKIDSTNNIDLSQIQFGKNDPFNK